MERWFFITIIAVIAFTVVGAAVSKYTIGQCRTAAIQRGLTADEIVRVCG